MGEQYVVSFLGIADKVIHPRHGVLSQHAVPSALLLEMQLPVSPLAHGVLAIAAIDVYPTGRRAGEEIEDFVES